MRQSKGMIQMAKLVFCAGLITVANLALASPINVECKGVGASQDRFAYQVDFTASIDQDSGTFGLEADGRGPGDLYDTDNRFADVPYAFEVSRDELGRPLQTKLSGEVIPGGRTLEVDLDLSRRNSEAGLEFMRKDGSLVFAQVACITSLPERCQKVHHCWHHCHPMIGCEDYCSDRLECKPGKFAHEN